MHCGTELSSPFPASPMYTLLLHYSASLSAATRELEGDDKVTGNVYCGSRELSDSLAWVLFAVAV